MKIRDLGEFPFLRRLRERLPHAIHDPRIQLGVGDDCAALSLPGLTVLTTDAMIAGVHFQCEWAPFFVLGQKAFAVNASDVAAMGGEPAFALLSLGVPQDAAVEDLDAFFDGFLEAAQQMRTTLIGGNMSAAPVFMISVSLLGQTPHGPIARSGARVEDEVYVTGTLGDANAGLRILQTQSANRRRPSAVETFLIRRHLRPAPRIHVGQLLGNRKLAHAAIDLSDGLASDVGHVCEESRVGAEIRATTLPLSSQLLAFARRDKRDPMKIALQGGEDYELLFTAPAKHHQNVLRVSEQTKVPITCIGEIKPKTFGRQLVLPSGRKQKLSRESFRHFNSR